MKSKLIYPIVVVVFAAACGGDGEDGKTVAGQQYETVQEGSAAGVTSSIAGPGETLPPITNTNADTTSAFALDPNAASMSPQPSGAVAGTMPPPSQPVYSGGMSPSYNPSPRAASPAPQRQTYVPPPMTSSTRPAPQPPPAQNTAPQPVEEPAEGPAPDTDTSATTNTAPPPPPTNTAPPPSEKPKQAEPEQEEPQDEEPAEEPPPPPPAR
ncbi:MAG TPA: hypothetical protein VE974_04265 [Thermoanaerobaculia bacterium]|nr:hypothetical protein [Thermoanaerobaculia bacterium]